ncbi:uncharacterized protein TRAVEDRAFT_49018 [Trametes versicolor FP-101664 SS1]|uniref:uncharacterized protein n=1 Tax=Trametes versicolor (strain FP-101664) TaxID=717944 RepID=UPI000462245B|nr:uncharacterized protein TRAVEDRAFT_49018 [Trametes versicolor FP-101664 SS1]EIW57999.1 hypothetical protein TRAVEDRAFT_49018 [Trametes versicolor FP-101664 SS1]
MASSCDPFLMRYPDQYDGIVHTGANARNLMFANGLLAAFVVCFYNDTARIARFDHAGAVVTAPLDLRSVVDMEILREFFWRFVHPWEGGPGRVVGSDSTMRLLTDEDRTWVEGQLGADVLAGVDLREGRRVEVCTEGEKPRGFVLFQIVAMTSSVFSRATTVWRAIEDTRGMGAVQDGPPEVHIVKEAWRRIDDPWEKQCYARLAAIPPEERYGLPGLVCGEDVGERESEKWKAECDHLLQGRDDLLLCTAVCGVPSAFGFGYGTKSDGLEPLEPPALPYPMHKTFTCDVVSALGQLDRSHMRLVVDTVGRPLSEFESSKELVTAIRDAIMGHRIALERAGILHCDISRDNIMLVNKELTHSGRHTFIGFLHDFDISWLSKVVPTKLLADNSGEDVQGSDESAGGATRATFADMPFPLDDDEVEELKTIFHAGTFHFHAAGLHYGENRVRTAQHDLESFYWVLVWMVMYHLPEYHGPLFVCREHRLFVSDDFCEAAQSKMTWLDSYRLEDVIDNPPLTALMSEFTSLALRGITLREPLTHDSVLAVFNAAIARDDWPDDPNQGPLSDSSLSPTSTAVPDRVELEDKVTSKRKFEAEEEGQENEWEFGEWIVEDSDSESEGTEPKRHRKDA